MRERDKRWNDFDSDDRTSYDAFAALPELFANIELMQPIRRSSIRFLIDSEGLGDTPNKQKRILCVKMHCLSSCEYKIDGKLEFRKNKAEKRMLIIKLYIGLILRRLKKISNIKLFSSVSFYFYDFEWKMVQSRTV